MPRKSAAALSVITPSPRSVLRPRKDASPEVRRRFEDIVSQAPADHFRPTDGPLLEQFAASIVLAEQAYAQIEMDGPVIDGKTSPWIVVLEKANRASATLAGRLRLCPQMRADSRSAGRKNGAPPSVYGLTEIDR